MRGLPLAAFKVSTRTQSGDVIFDAICRLTIYFEHIKNDAGLTK
jgi:hypothetical protein